MSAILLRLLIYAIIGGMIYFSIKRILSDWKKQFRADDQSRRERDRHEAQRPDVVTLKKDKDGVFRPDSTGKSGQKRDRERPD